MRDTKRRAIAMLVLALVLAGGAVLLARNWLHAHRTSIAGAEPGQALATTSLVVAAAPLRFGDEVRPEHLRLVEWPEAAVPDGAFRALETVLGPDEAQPRVVLRPIEKDEPVLAAKITGFGARASLSTLIAPGMRATTIPVNDVRGVAGFVRPGDRVDILLTRAPSGRRAGRDPATEILLQNMNVLGVDQDAGAGPDRAGMPRAVTLEVTAVQAQKLTLAHTLGTLSLVLRHRDTLDARAPRAVTVRDLHLGPAEPAASDPTPARDGGGNGAGLARLLAEKARKSSVRIVRGLESSKYEVRAEGPGLGMPAPAKPVVPWSCAAPLGPAPPSGEADKLAPAACPTPEPGGQARRQ